MSPLQDWLRDGQGRDEALALLRELSPILGGAFGEAAEEPDGLDPHFYSFFGTMPMRSLLEFAAPSGGPDPDARLAAMMESATGTQ
jgi:hypothetical protein